MFNAYLESQPTVEAQGLRDVIDPSERLSPIATEGRSYVLAAYRYKGKPLLGFAATTQHFEPLAVQP